MLCRLNEVSTKTADHSAVRNVLSIPHHPTSIYGLRQVLLQFGSCPVTTFRPISLPARQCSTSSVMPLLGNLLVFSPETKCSSTTKRRKIFSAIIVTLAPRQQILPDILPLMVQKGLGRKAHLTQLLIPHWTRIQRRRATRITSISYPPTTHPSAMLTEQASIHLWSLEELKLFPILPRGWKSSRSCADQNKVNPN